ncbi:L,D-transpeptidase [Rivularia sp. UHCC 0363]|uniref:L,D-transpeptidase family protein n=1 Tax=Rivularia sp. UHCC 0363 TaxID=3110244 RepID=UPI002B20A101|nr:L,D-transpeptidase [Rivularia sp. UHCC 0363]MEA5594479.1 L,D-transpeptidase [Rivularia sp. UHCC 0363]
MNLKYQNQIKIILLLVCSISTIYFLLARLGFIFPVTDIAEVLCLKGCKSPQAIHSAIPGNELLNYSQTVDKLIGENIDKSKTSILIEKSKHRITLYYNQKPIKSYPVVFGSSPKGDKLKEGDRRTPEGIHRIKDLYPHSSWSKFMWLDYPNAASWRKHFQAKNQGKISWFNSIGGQVGIHGVPQGSDQMIDNQENWTWGCPSLKNQDVDELYKVVKIGTLVEVLP